MHKDVESILISQEKLENTVKSLAKQIEKDYNGKEFIMVGLLISNSPSPAAEIFPFSRKTAIVVLRTGYPLEPTL